ncbi:MAG TPA: hypothetical protein VD963_07205, partial [Phycisphaerales bacterium]|nr:hypothetical protein [Phycisphaerales bacterium]
PELELGVYWGFPQHVMRTWDQAGYELLDPDNPEHVDLGFAELDLITSVNATMVGLDAYVYMSPGKAHRWLNMMRQRAPQARFVLEPSNADIYHTVAATWQFVEQVDGPTVLADFLNPGHETWVAIQYNVLEAQLGRPMTQAEKMEVARRYASWGYTPLIFEQFTPTADMLAQESWNRTVPPQYRIATSTNSNFAPGTVSQNSDGTVTMVSAWVPEAPAAGDAPALGAAQAGPGDGGGTMIGGWVPGRERRAPARNAAVAGSRVPDLGAAALIPPGIARRASAPEPAARLPAARANHAAPSLRVPAPVVHRRAPPAVTDQMRDVLFPGAALASALEIAGAPTARPPGSAAAFFDPGKVAEAIARARGHQPRALANVPTP